MENETRWIEGYEGMYKVSTGGEIFSERRREAVSGRWVGGSKRKVSNHGTGYSTVGLANNGKCRTFRVHRLVAEAFLDNPNDLPFVNHLNGNKRDNRVDNLEWVSAKENTAHAIETGLINVSGVDNPACRFTYEDVIDWYVMYTHGVFIKDICTAYECTPHVIRRLIVCELGDILPKYSGRHPYR